MSRSAIKERSILELGDSVPEPLGFNALAPECLVYTEGTCTEDRAPQGCDPSADARAGMARGGSSNARPKHSTQDTVGHKLIAGQKWS